ncbi:MAG: 30S ribosomal protein S20 [Alphaproteobacteria bacterium]|nr:30S ribosomal protein S20 [Alphaproteobacteria bacterium]HCP00750.1 30S ribosomal protein S20 [Rhodospirillaceae bacterium]|tara:strand:- start:496 stop:759 length:264 start_codon:yes stop_codon:yes gene_type:complete
MANHHSAKVRIRRNDRRAAINGNRIGRIRTRVKQVEAAIAEGNKPAAEAALRAAQPEMHRGAQKGVIHANTVSRKLSRLSARIKALS